MQFLLILLTFSLLTKFYLTQMPTTTTNSIPTMCRTTLDCPSGCCKKAISNSENYNLYGKTNISCLPPISSTSRWRFSAGFSDVFLVPRCPARPWTAAGSHSRGSRGDSLDTSGRRRRNLGAGLCRVNFTIMISS